MNNFHHQLIPLDEHLEELSMLCIFMDEVVLDPEKKEIIANTNKIGEWLKLASDLKSVEISPGGYESPNDMFCEPRMDFLSENRLNYGLLSLHITKFIFLMHAMDNTQKFIQSKSIGKISGIKTPSVRSEYEYSKITIDKYPSGFVFYSEQFISRITPYIHTHKVPVKNPCKVEINNPAYAHCMLRNLRNYIFHGDFPLQYGFDGLDPYDISNAVQLLNHASRITCLYIQCAILNFCNEMESASFYSHKERCEEIIELQEEEDLMSWAYFYINNFGKKIAFDMHHGLEHKITSYIW